MKRVIYENDHYTKGNYLYVISYEYFLRYILKMSFLN